MCRLIGERGISCNRRNEQVSKILLNKEKCRALLWEGRIVLGKVGRRAYIAIGSINLCVCLLHNTDFTIAYMLHNFSCQIGGGWPEHVFMSWLTCPFLLQVLQDTLTNLHAAGEQNPFYQPCHTHVLNPKSITMEELYGGINKLTLEWSDGLMAMTVRSCVTVGGIKN